MQHLVVVDGSNLLFQMFYGMPARILSPSGKPVQGTLGFVGALLKILRMTNPTHVAVVFDGECENSRTALDESYKANRPDWSQMAQEELPFSQLPDIYAALELLGICHRETEDCEADDWIAAYAMTAGIDRRVTAVSQDSDYFQLISPFVQVLRYRGKQTAVWDEALLWRRLGIRGEQYADLKALTGDSSDNIRGLQGVGPKTAAALMARFGSLENLLVQAETLEKPWLREAVLENRERLMCNYRLIKLDGKHPLPFPVEQLLWKDRGLTTTEILEKLHLK